MVASFQRLQDAGLLAPLATFLVPKEGAIDATFHGEKAKDIARLRCTSKLFNTFFTSLRDPQTAQLSVQRQLLGAAATSATFTAQAVQRVRALYPNLSSVTIVAGAPSVGDLVIDDVRALNEILTLHTVRLQANSYVDFSCMLSQIMRPIQSLHIDFRNLAAIVPFINAIPSLKELDFYLIHDMSVFDTELEPLEHVERLCFRTSKPHYFEHIHLITMAQRTPALQTIVLHCPHLELISYTHTQAILPPHIRLVVGACTLTSPTHFHENLAQFQELETLQISYDHYLPTPEFVQDLQGLRHLKEIYLYQNADWDFTSSEAKAWKRALPHLRIIHKETEVSPEPDSLLSSCTIM